jgi:Cu+-exporting ATPase
MKQKYDVEGMMCAVCQSHVEKAVNKLQGVKKVDVNLISNNMVVEYDESVLTDEVIIGAVNEAGYKASIDQKKN